MQTSCQVEIWFSVCTAKLKMMTTFVTVLILRNSLRRSASGVMVFFSNDAAMRAHGLSWYRHFI